MEKNKNKNKKNSNSSNSLVFGQWPMTKIAETEKRIVATLMTAPSAMKDWLRK